MENYFLPHEKLQALLDSLMHAGYQCVGPQPKNNTIIYDEITRAEQLPWGLRDIQKPGAYRLEKIHEHKAFSWANGPQAIKPQLFKSSETVWRVKRNDQGKLEFNPVVPDEKPIAIIGARACDISAMLIQDKVFLDKPYPDLHYQHRREKIFIVGVNCTYASANCFCVSAGNGPRIREAYDLALTEIDGGLVITGGSDRGNAILTSLSLTCAQMDQEQQAAALVNHAADSQVKRIPLNNTRALREILFNHLDHPQWEAVAERCLSCGNCTSVCPTCFCFNEHDVPALSGEKSTHQREWGSCFTAEHSVVNHHVLRDDTKKRYRQWLTHKVGSWFDQFGVSGCVGCGRCITWCPVGIDLTEELAVITGESNEVTS